MNQLVTKPCRILVSGLRRHPEGGSWPFLAVGRALSLTPRAHQGNQNSNSNNNQEFRHSEDLAQERYDMRADEPTDKKRARLMYQSRKRGMLENGVILASFADKFLATLDKDQLDQYDRLINLPTNDWDIFYWATKTKPTPTEFETPVMQMLRHHLNSKVSRGSVHEEEGAAAVQDNGGGSGSTQNKGRQELPSHNNDILMPAVRDHYDLEIDYSATSLTNYEQELFDNRVKKFSSGETMLRMTEWRKGYFLKRLRRTLPSPISLRNLDENKQVEVFTQKVTDKNIASNEILQTDLIDSQTERKLKHHNLLQHLMSSKFTDNVRDYEEEAQAWAEILWHRSYGSADVTIAPSQIKCTSCSAKLHCCDPGLSGYMPKELFAKLQASEQAAILGYADDENSRVQCQRCQFKSVYNVSLGVDTRPESYAEILREISRVPRSIVCLLVDLTDFPCGIWEGLIDLIGTHHKVLVVGNKLDLLPHDGPLMIQRVTNSLRNCLSILRPGKQNLYIQDVMVLSARTGFGIESLVARLCALAGEKPRDIYLLGCSNSGKSTLFSALLQSDLSAIRDGDLLGRVSEYKFPGTQHNMLRFPITMFDGWEIELKKRRLERVERNFKVYERALDSKTKARQATTPHVSLLIDRTEYPPLPASSSISSQDAPTSIITIRNVEGEEEEEPNFSEDHPLKAVKSRELFSATREEFSENGFMLQVPSTSHPDQLHDLLTNDEKLEVFPNETIIPRKYSIRPLQSIFIAGLARLDLLTANSTVQFTIFASRYLPVHVIATRKADQFYNNFLGTPYLGIPFGDEQRIREWPPLENGNSGDFNIRGRGMVYGAADIVLSSAGWALVTLPQDQECIVRGFTPAGRGIFRRHEPVLPYGAKLNRNKIRDTPLFRHPNYKIEVMSA